MDSILSSDPERSWFLIAKAFEISTTTPSLTSASTPFWMTRRFPFPGASQLGFDRQNNGIEVRLITPSPCLQRRGDLRPAQPDFDPIGRDGYLLNNVPEEAFQLDVRHGEPSLGKRECIVQGRIQRMSIKIERCERVTDVDPGGQQRSQAIEHQPFDVPRRDAHSLLCLRTFASQK